MVDDLSREDESELDANFENARPKILGALLDGVSHGLRHLKEITKPEIGYPRLAAMAKWILACEEQYGPKGTFLPIYKENIAEAQRRAINVSI